MLERKLQVRSGLTAQRLLMDNPQGLKVHSIFKNAVNLIAEEDYLITLLPMTYSGGPLHVLMDGRDFLELKSSGMLVGERVALDKLVDWSSSTVLDYRLQKAAQYNSEQTLRENIGQCNGYWKPGYLVERYQSYCGRLKACVEKKDPHMLAEALMPLLGFGQGLTPSGDDFIYGMMAVFFYHCTYSDEDPDWLKAAAGYIAKAARDKTTIISYNMLRTCVDTAFLQWINDLMQALFCGDRTVVRKAAEKVARIGSSSGKDMILGVIYGMNNIGYKEGLHGFQMFGKEECIL